VKKNQLVNVALGEKLSALRTEEYFAERAARVSLRKRFKFSSVRARGIRRFLLTNWSQRECVVAISPP
jgi:hypothetical protein